MDEFVDDLIIAKKIAAMTDCHAKPGEPDTHFALLRILSAAYHQSKGGKGQERHGNGKPFDKQPIMEIARMVGVGGQTFQICKKAQEATTMVERGQLDAAKHELLGAIVYAAAAVLLIEEKQGERK
ncbi:hypothetical protein [Methylosinus sp. PW1]|uniref:hypothetical protein n=1 Tax=Methylosinus sp. PW1 TaxID=107636 RepID=UPI0012EB3E56|nr:hypothetical protein [Methylosinus sp. PW1]